MIQKKVCMLGAFAVGKTSLVSRFVHSIFSEKYLSTVGVKIDKKVIGTAAGEVTLVLWDIYGEDELQRVQMSYLRGAAGYLLVVDGTRRDTLDKALSLRERAAEAVGPVPLVAVLNKCDLVEDWDLDDAAVGRLSAGGWPVVRASAKTGEGVEEAFAALTARMTGG